MSAAGGGNRRFPLRPICLTDCNEAASGPLPLRDGRALSMVVQELPAAWCSFEEPRFLLIAGPHIEPALAVLPESMGPQSLLAGSVVQSLQVAPCCGSTLLVGVSGGDGVWRHARLHRHPDPVSLLPVYLRDAYPPGADSGNARLGGLMLGWAEGSDGVVSRVGRLLWLHESGLPLGWSYLPRPPLTLAAVTSDLHRTFPFARPAGGGPVLVQLLDSVDTGGPALAVSEHLDRYGAAALRWLDVFQAALLQELREVG